MNPDSAQNMPKDERLRRLLQVVEELTIVLESTANVLLSYKAYTEVAKVVDATRRCKATLTAPFEQPRTNSPKKKGKATKPSDKKRDTPKQHRRSHRHRDS